MFLTILSGISLVALGIAGFLGWERMGNPGEAAEMLMPVFFGVTFLICAGFSRVHYRHGLYGGLIMALLGVVSAIIRLYQYEGLTSIEMAKTRLIAAMAALCVMQLLISWRAVQEDRKPTAPNI